MYAEFVLIVLVCGREAGMRADNQKVRNSTFDRVKQLFPLCISIVK